MRDINMWEFEAKPTLKEKQDQLQKDLTLLADTKEMHVAFNIIYHDS